MMEMMIYMTAGPDGPVDPDTLGFDDGQEGVDDDDSKSNE